MAHDIRRLEERRWDFSRRSLAFFALFCFFLAFDEARRDCNDPFEGVALSSDVTLLYSRPPRPTRTSL